MKRFALAVVVLFAVAFAFPAAGFACGTEGDHAKGEGEHAHKAACPMKDKKVAEKTEVAMTGHLLCMHCNLHKEEKCRKVFQSADNQEKLYNLCPGAKVDLEAIAEEGAATVSIKGHLVKAEDGTEMLMIESAEKVAPKA
jgi:hypothetical protein